METKTVKLTLEQARELYNQGGNFKTIALGAYSEEELTESNLPNSWREFCDHNFIKPEECYINNDCEIVEWDICSTRRYFGDKNFIPNKKTAKAVLALCQLIQLRDCYNQGWEPDWTINTIKYCIDSNCNIVIKDSWGTCSRTMAFKTEKLRDKFFDNFKDLLETAKELL